MLQTANFTQARDNLKTFCDDVIKNNSTLIIVRKDEQNVVVQSLESYNLIQRELKMLKEELFIQKRMLIAQKEIKEGKSKPASEVFSNMRAIVEGRKNV